VGGVRHPQQTQTGSNSSTIFFLGGGGDASRFKADYFHTNLLQKKKMTRLHVLYASVKDKLTLCSEGDFSPSYLQ